LVSRVPDNNGMKNAWGRRERVRIANGLLRNGLVEIRFLAGNPDSAEHPGGALSQIHMIADACHNLAGAGKVRPTSPYDYDPFVYLWHTSTVEQRLWLTRQLEDLGADYRWLTDTGPWPPPAQVPARRPQLRRRGIRFPRSPREYVALDTATLRELVMEASALEPPGRPSRGLVLAHLDPAGRHLVRASRPGEPLFLPAGPADLRQYRGLLQMGDGSVVVGHMRLRSSSFAALPPNMSTAERLLLAATVSQPHERDFYLWMRAHNAADPHCRLCNPQQDSDGSSDA
jgi:hypothetical protein